MRKFMESRSCGRVKKLGVEHPAPVSYITPLFHRVTYFFVAKKKQQKSWSQTAFLPEATNIVMIKDFLPANCQSLHDVAKLTTEKLFQRD